MRVLIHTTLATALLAVSLSAQAPVNADAKVLADFTARVKAYSDLRDKVDGGAAHQVQTSDPAKLDAQKRALAANVMKSRAGAKPGDIFTADVQTVLRKLLKPSMTGTDGAENKKTIKEESPAIALKVNAPYPEKQPLSTVPPDVLKSLPPLPKDLEYRFAQRNLILFDSRASLVIDVLPNAIP